MKISTLCYIFKGSSMLMLYRNRKKDDPNAGKWIGVGGKQEENESPDDCLLREVREETGLRLLSYRLSGIVTFVSDTWETELMFLYTSDEYVGTEYFSGCDEGELKWIDEKDVLSLPLWEGDKIFLGLLRQYDGVFSLKLCYRGDMLVRAVLDGRELEL